MKLSVDGFLCEKSVVGQSKPRICIKVPLIRAIIQIINVGIIHLLILAHLIVVSGLENQKTIIMMPKTSAAVPKTTCDQTSIDANIDKLAMVLIPSANLEIITVKIRTVCSITARTVR